MIFDRTIYQNLLGPKFWIVKRMGPGKSYKIRIKWAGLNRWHKIRFPEYDIVRYSDGLSLKRRFMTQPNIAILWRKLNIIDSYRKWKSIVENLGIQVLSKKKVMISIFRSIKRNAPKKNRQFSIFDIFSNYDKDFSSSQPSINIVQYTTWKSDFRATKGNKKLLYRNLFQRDTWMNLLWWSKFFQFFSTKFSFFLTISYPQRMGPENIL